MPAMNTTPAEYQRKVISPQNVLWQRGNVAFLCVGKCACTSVKLSVLEAQDITLPDGASPHFSDRVPYVTPEDLRDMSDHVVPELVAVARDPIERFVSFWADKVSGRERTNYDFLGFSPSMSLSEAIRHLWNRVPNTNLDCHLAPQTLLHEVNGGGRVPALVSMRDLPRYWEQNRGRWSLAPLPVTNIHSPPDVELSSHERYMLGSFYKRDEAFTGW